MNDPQTLDDVKAGDTVFICSGGYSRAYKAEIVVRVTETQIVCADARFAKRSGDKVGDGSKRGRHSFGWRTPYILVGQRARDYVAEVDSTNQRRRLEGKLSARHALTQEGIKELQQLCTEAEAYLRAAGEWINF
jgi:hypothetical protein